MLTHRIIGLLLEEHDERKISCLNEEHKHFYNQHLFMNGNPQKRRRSSPFKPPLKKAAKRCVSTAEAGEQPEDRQQEQRADSEGPPNSSRTFDPSASTSSETEQESLVPSAVQDSKCGSSTDSSPIAIEISQLLSEGYRVEDFTLFKKKLHEYNEVKDLGQALLGRLAVHKQVTTKELYEEYGLSLDD